MDANEKILAVENRIIDELTTFSWWTEVNFEIDNCDLNLFSFQGYLFCFSLAFGYFSLLLYTDKAFLQMFACFVISLLLFLLLIVSIFKFSSLKEDCKKETPQVSPNPNRYSRTQSILRRMYVSVTLFSFCLFAVYHEELFLLLSIAFCFLSLTLFFSACDSLPPNEKQKRKEAASFTKNKSNIVSA